MVAGFIDAFSLNASRITTGILNANRVGAGTLTADKMVAGFIDAFSLNASRITTGILNANRVGAGTLTADKMVAGFIDAFSLNASRITTGILNANRVGAGTLTADKIALGQGLVRSQRILTTVAYGPGATISNYNTVNSSVTDVELGVVGGVDTITFRVTETRSFVDPTLQLTDGQVQTPHIALSATADLYVARWSGDDDIFSTASTLVSVIPPGAAGFKYIAIGQVLFTTSGNNDAGLTARITRGGSVIGSVTAGDGTDRSINWGIPVAASGTHSSAATIALQASHAGSGSCRARSAVLSVYVAKR